MRLLPLLALVGCTYHLPHHSPGRIDPRKPPPDGVDVEEPGDPGEVVTNLTAGGYAGVGVGFSGDGWDGAGVAAEAGAELGLHWGALEESHEKPDHLPFAETWPADAVGVNVGASVVNHHGDELALGHLFVEGQRRLQFGGAAAGYGYSPADGAHGPHVTLFFSTLYLRASYLFDRGPSVVFGIVMKVPAVTWVRSR